MIRTLIEKCLEWDQEYVIIALDFRRAFDCISLKAAIDFCLVEPLPLRLRFALFKELLADRQCSFRAPGICTNWIEMQKGFRQGSPESSFLFALILNHILNQLHSKWAAQGKGFKFGKFGGNENACNEWGNKHAAHCEDFDPQSFCLSCIAFVDDCYLFAKNLQDAQDLLNDVVEAFRKVQLCLAPEKVKFIAEKHLGHVVRPCLTLEGSEIERVDNLKILGS